MANIAIHITKYSTGFKNSIYIIYFSFIDL